MYGMRVASELPLHQDRVVDGGGPPDVVLTVGESRSVPTAEPDGLRLAHAVDNDGTRYYSFARLPHVPPSAKRLNAARSVGLMPVFRVGQ